MGLTDLLILDVSPEEFRVLKVGEDDLRQEAIETISDPYRKRVDVIQTSFRYNPKRALVGIWIGDEANRRLAYSRSCLNEEETTLVYALREKVQEGLEIIRGGLEAEEWVDEIEPPANYTLTPDDSKKGGSEEPLSPAAEKDDIPF